MTVIVSDLSQRGSDRWLLRDVSFSVEPGEVFGVYIADADARVALISALSGEVQPVSGSVNVKPDQVYTLAGGTRGIFLRVFGGRTIMETSPDAIVADAVRSGKKLIALSTLPQPAEISSRSLAFRKMRDAAADKKFSVVYVTNIFSDIFEFCDKAAVVESSYLLQTGTPQDLYDNPETAATAAATGRCNLIEARRLTSSTSEAPEYVTINGEHRLSVEKVKRSALSPLNQNLTLGVRPENISISFGASFPEDNLLKASVTNIQPMGATTFVEFDAGGLKLTAMVMRLVGLNVGDECMIGLPPDRIKIFK